MEKYIKINDKKLGTTNEPKAPYLDFEGNYCNLKVSTIEDYDIYFDKVYYKENNIIIVPKRDFTYTDPSNGKVYSGLYHYGFDREHLAYSGSQYVLNPTNAVYRTELTQEQVEELTNIKPIGSAESAFDNCKGITDLKGVEKTWDTSEITSMKFMFDNIGNLSSANDKYITLDLSNWDFSNVTNIDYMFFYCGASSKGVNITFPPNGLNTVKLESARAVFGNSTKIREAPMMDLKNLKNASEMFLQSCIYTIPKYNLKNVVYANMMFQECQGRRTDEKGNIIDEYGITTLPQLDLRNLRQAHRMFYHASNLKNIPELDTHNLSVMNCMFYWCERLPADFPWIIDMESITEAPKNPSSDKNFDYLEPYPGAYWMFNSSGVKRVTIINLDPSLRSAYNANILGATPTFIDPEYIEITNDNHKFKDLMPDRYDKMIRVFTKKFDRTLTGLTDASEMFKDCYNLIYMPYIDTSKIKDMISMFENCTNLEEEFDQPIDIRSISNPEKLRNMFKNTPTKVVNFICPNTNIRNQITSQLLKGDNSLKINFLNYKLISSKLSNYYSDYGLIEFIKDYIHLNNNVSYLFDGFVKLKVAPMFELDNVTDISYMFNNCTKLENMTKYDLNNIVNVSGMFNGCTALKTIPDLNTNSAENMSYLFNNCSNLLNIPNIVTDNATNMKGTFKDCVKISNITNINTNKVTNMDEIFSGCTNLESINSLNTDSIESMNKAFYNCQKLTDIPSDTDISKAKANIYEIFYNCQNLRSVPLLDPVNITSLEYMFYNCKEITEVNFTEGSLESGSITNIDSVFYGCSNLNSIPYINTENITNMKNAFYGCSSIDSEFPWIIDCVGLSNTNYSNVEKANSLSNMFKGTQVTNVTYKNVKDDLVDYITSNLLKGDDTLNINFINIIETPKREVNLENYTVTSPYFSSRSKGNDGNTRVSDAQLSNDNIIYLTNIKPIGKMTKAFAILTNMTTLNGVERTWDTSEVTDMASLFYSCSKITSLNLSKWNFDKVQKMNSAFYGCSALTTINKESFNLPSCTTLYQTFYNCVSLTKLPLITNGTGITDIRYIACSSKASNLDEFVGSLFCQGNNIKSCQNAFSTANFNNRFPTEIDTSNVTNMENMFQRCTGLPSTIETPFDCRSLIPREYTFNGKVGYASPVGSMFYQAGVVTINLINVKRDVEQYLTASNFGVSRVNILSYID